MRKFQKPESARPQADLFTGHAIELKPASSGMNPKAPDAGDQFLWDLLASRADLVLVTGDKLLLQDLAMQEQVMLPQVFVGRFLH